MTLSASRVSYRSASIRMSVSVECEWAHQLALSSHADSSLGRVLVPAMHLADHLSLLRFAGSFSTCGVFFFGKASYLFETQAFGRMQMVGSKATGV